MRLLLRVLRVLLIAVVGLAAVAGGGGYLWLRGALPQTAGVTKVQGITEPVEIRRDSDGVPHIRAGSEADALFGLGYVHAQDRLWQMEFQRRIGYGRLAELAGESRLKTDKFLRTLGIPRAAQRAWASASPTTKRWTESYVAGINTFIDTHQGRELPVEFALLGIQPERWRPEDTIVWSKMMAWDLGGNWDQELLRSKLAAKFGPDQAAQLMPASLLNDPIILPQSAVIATTQRPSAAMSPSLGAQSDELLAINRVLQDEMGLGGVMIGSNNWVVAGTRTTTGKPLLANDPHLGMRIPSIWYLAHLTAGRLDVIGATLPGIPAVVIGHNQRIAWGFTNTNPDVQDFYIERINERNEAEHNGAWEPMQVVQEVIKVKGQPDVTIQVRITRHGPLLSDVVEDAQEPLALRWTALDDEDRMVDAFIGMATAANWDEFVTALSHFKAPMQNIVYADVDGNIGYYVPGALPIRAKGDGTAPVPGWTDEYDWTGYVPFAELPHAYNPPEGYIVTANNKAVPDSYPYLISTAWSAPYRAMRIIELIKNTPQLSPNDMAGIQADVNSAQARELLPYLLTATPPDERSRAAIELLRNWDGEIAGDSPQAAIFEGWYQQLPQQIYADELGDALWKSYQEEPSFIAMQLSNLLKGAGGAWCDNSNTPQPENCQATLGKALAAGLADMTNYQGTDDMRAWRWDRAHNAMFPHNALDGVAALKPIFSRSIPNNGDGFTVNVAPIRRTEPYNQYHGPSYRHIVDLSDLNASRFMHTVGQSGYVLSPHYDDLIERWQRVEFLPMRYDRATIDAATEERLMLEP